MGKFKAYLFGVGLIGVIALIIWYLKPWFWFNRKQAKQDLGASQTGVVVDKDLYTLAARKAKLEEAVAKEGTASANKIVEILQYEPALETQSLQKGDKTTLTTNGAGQIMISLQKGTYKLQANPIEMYDFTNLPAKISLDEKPITVMLGIKVGSGKIFLREDFSSDPVFLSSVQKAPEGRQYFILELFGDTNNNQIKDETEKIVLWAGVKIILEKQPETGFGKLLR